jgi:hypothetical protein
MAVTTFAGWVADGRPWDPAFPVDDLAVCLRGYGYTVYILGNQDHATAQPPEDHMPYSHTPWPGRQPYPYVLACDIMPPPAGKGLPSLAQLAAQLFADRQAGVAGALWIKYMNWEPSGGSGPCFHDSWQPKHARTSSTDRGHIHISGRTDFVTSHAADDYDPIARIRGDDMSELFPAFGDKGEAVKRVQVQLDTLGYTIGTKDGIYGATLAAAVKKFRADHGITSPGDGKKVTGWMTTAIDADLNALIAKGDKGDPGPAGPTGPKGDAAVLAPGSTLTVT